MKVDVRNSDVPKQHFKQVIKFWFKIQNLSIF